MSEQNLELILIKISFVKDIGMTEIQKWAKDFKINEKTTMRMVQELVKRGSVKKISVRGHGHKRYRVVTSPVDEHHRMYTKRLMLNKTPILQTQTELRKEISEVTEIFYSDFQNRNKDEFERKDFMIISWILNLHSKLTWAINFGWFSNYGNEIHLAKTNRKDLDEFIKKINKIFYKKNPNLWAKIMHIIYDRIDYEMDPLAMVWSRLPISSNNITVRKRNK